MKRVNTIIIALALVIATIGTKADPRTSKQRLTIPNAVKGFQEAFVNGKIKGFSELLDDNVKFTITRGDKVITYTKDETLENLRKSANTVQNCETSHEIVESLPNQTVVKFSMKYENFTKENYITLTESDSGWKITHVSTSFK